MSQFENPPSPPGVPGTAVAGVPWSATAISAFVLSFLGCTLAGAVLALILGVVGIVQSSGGKRKGMGLAIAAIPISLLTGVVGVIVMMSFMFLSRAGTLVTNLPEVLDVAEGEPAMVAAFREVATEDLNESVDDAALIAWLKQVTETRGKLVSLEISGNQPGNPPGELSFDGKFVDGDADIRIRFGASESIFSPKIDDIQISGVSLRPE